MALTTGRKAIRFLSWSDMSKAIEQDWPYQHRHMLLHYLGLRGPGAVCTRRELSDNAGIPVNAISRVCIALEGEGLLLPQGRVECPVTGRISMGVSLNTEHKGPY